MPNNSSLNLKTDVSARRFFIAQFLNNDKNISKINKKLLTNDNYCAKTILKITVLEENHMWNKNKSIMLTHFIVRACYVIFAMALISLPFALNRGFLVLPYFRDREIMNCIIGSLLAVVPAGYLALVCIDKLLINVKGESIFNEKNVKLLRIISWACFYAGLVGVVLFLILCNKIQFLLWQQPKCLWGLQSEQLKTFSKRQSKSKKKTSLPYRRKVCIQQLILM